MPRTRRQPKTNHLKLTVAYDGTRYGGWQRQPNRVTIQQLVEQAASKLARKRVVVHGSGRTDAGVHARTQVASCSFATHLTMAILCRALNANLPDDIRVTRVEEVGAKFHARVSATAKEYRYQIDAGMIADPFLRAYAWHRPWRLDLPAMRRAARMLVGRHDFTALSVKSKRRPVRTIKRLTLTERGNLLTIAVTANGFLYKMVRSIVGALVKVGEGRLTADELRELMRARKRTPAVETAPAHGLFLWKVDY